MTYLFWTCLLLMAYVFQGYVWLLRLIPGRAPAAPPDPAEDAWPHVTVLLTVYNEEDEVVPRLQDLLAQDYPADKLHVLVASDGSEDATEARAAAVGDARISVFRPEHSDGKTDTQNQAVAHARGELLVFTDAETRFAPDFLRRIAAPFGDPRVGGASGCLRFQPTPGSGLAVGQGFYWRYEQRVREEEHRLGLSAVASGACMAVRRALFRPMRDAYGEDCLLPLDVVAQGYRFVHVADAHAQDRMPDSPRGEFAARIRMTQRNWQGTWCYPALLNPLRHPGYAFALWSHKLLRWLSPLFLAGATVGAAGAAVQGPAPYRLVVAAMAAFYLAAAVGWWTQRRGLRGPVVHTAYGFLLANAGFAVGLWRALRGRHIRRYRHG